MWLWPGYGSDRDNFSKRFIKYEKINDERNVPFIFWFKT